MKINVLVCLIQSYLLALFLTRATFVFALNVKRAIIIRIENNPAFQFFPPRSLSPALRAGES